MELSKKIDIIKKESQMKLFETNLNQDTPTSLPLIPTIDVVAFPQMIIPLLIIDEKIIGGIQHAMEQENKLVVIVACKKDINSESFSIGAQDLYNIGTVAQIIKVIPEQDGSTKILIQGLYRVSISDIKISSILTGKIIPLAYEELSENQLEEYEKKLDTIKNLICNFSHQNPLNKDLHVLFNKEIQKDKIIEFILSHLTLNVHELQKMLTLNSYIDLLNTAIEYCIRETEIITIKQKAKNRAKESINNNQREFYLREQIKALKEELGENNEEIDNFRQKLYSIEDVFSKESFKEILQCINRLENMSLESAEAGILRTYLEYIFDLPWEIETKDNSNITKAKKILDDDHYGLDHIKERVLDFLSVKQLSKQACGTILCLYGPPGVGKTSLAESIARAMGRKSFRIAVGGMKDEAEIRGHRRTYVGAMPGRIIKGLRQVQSKNPVIIIDEIDKISSEFRGDPASALLEVFDYNQNNLFYDYYLGVPFDLSNVFFIATANTIENIPQPLQDRMETIQLNAYSMIEKNYIAKNYLIKKSQKEAGLHNKNIIIKNDVITKMITHYTCEAGIRDLERTFKKLFYKLARIFIETNKLGEVTQENLHEYLGIPKYERDPYTPIAKAGVAQGLCYTSYGGEVLFIETILVTGSGKLILTGQLGDVMKESAQIACNVIKSKKEKFSIAQDTFTNYDIHIHVPAGAIPKDGPSAGVAIFSSILSAIKNIQLKNNIAMTGEIDLCGLVLPVGGIKEKVLAAKKNGITNILIPKNNMYDIMEIQSLLEEINIIYIQNIEEAMSYLFSENIIAATENLKESMDKEENIEDNKKNITDSIPSLL